MSECAEMDWTCYCRSKAYMLFKPIVDKLKGEYQELFMYCFNKLDAYWFFKPASSTGKYHPAFNNGEGGLVRHTYGVCQWWNFYYRAYEGKLKKYLKRDDIYDLGIIACIFHDAKKYGDSREKSQYTKKDHDVLSATWFKECWATYRCEHKTNISDTAITLIANAIDHHNGPWSTHGAPRNIFEHLVFLSDYASSAKIHENEELNTFAYNE